VLLPIIHTIHSFFFGFATAYYPHIKKCVRVIVEEEVVSTVVDEKVTEMNELRGRDSSRIW
jgi:hypothetical protein